MKSQPEFRRQMRANGVRQTRLKSEVRNAISKMEPDEPMKNAWHLYNANRLVYLTDGFMHRHFDCTLREYSPILR